jgi:hypothetical protein
LFYFVVARRRRRRHQLCCHCLLLWCFLESRRGRQLLSPFFCFVLL